MSDDNPERTVRDAIHAMNEGVETSAERQTVAAAAGHYADFVSALTTMYGPGAQASLEVAIGKAVEQHIEKAVTRGGASSVQELGRAALKPVLARLATVVQ